MGLYDPLAEAFVLVTAMPPTVGHIALIEFASIVAPTTVIVTTQPHEPYPRERFEAISLYFKGNPRVTVKWFNKPLPQDPATPMFKEMWRDLMTQKFFFCEGDYIVASEPYGQWLADMCKGQFLPYDIPRDFSPARASNCRLDPARHWDEILPEFRPVLETRVTFFGAESVGKTTLSKQVAEWLGGTWIPEYARPYLETVGNEITDEKMVNIWKGQCALQEQAFRAARKPILIQDTDLWSTVGYYGLYDPQSMPQGLVEDAMQTKSDLYVILSVDDVPFEPDPLRYGGHQRESDDAYWISLCERYGLNYVVVKRDRKTRYGQAVQEVVNVAKAKLATMRFEREAND